jgi:hypothetical protein
VVFFRTIDSLLRYHTVRLPKFTNSENNRAGTLSFLCQKRKKHALFSLFFPKTRNSCITVVKYLKSIIFKVFEKNKEKKANLYLCWKKKRFSNYAFFCFFQRFIEEFPMEFSNELALSCFFVHFCTKKQKKHFSLNPFFMSNRVFY